jgi:chromosomal replication initiator protein
METIWEAVKPILATLISPSGFSLWIEPLQAMQGSEGELVLICPNAFALRWLQSHYLELICQTLLTACAFSKSVRLSMPTVGPSKPVPALVNQPPLPQLLTAKAGSRGLNGAYTFDQFVVGPSNRLAYQASQALARNDTFYNRILFLTSGPGLGKSHLSQAVGNFLRQTAPGGQILYLTAEDFANRMVGALKNGQMDRFKEQFRGECEVLLLEEVQFLSGKEKIQAELCYTLDSLLTRQRRLVFTSCYLPGEISQLSQELKSRLTGGIITPIGPPDFQTRVKILAKKAEDRGLQAPPRVLTYLAEHVTGDVRRLESALDCLAARSTLLNEPVSLGLAQEVLQDLKAVDAGLGVTEIQKIVCDYYQVRRRELLGRSRQKRLVRARQMALYFSRLYTQKTLMELGRLFMRSHATVVHALQTLERDRQTQPRLAAEVKFLEGKLAQAQVKGESRPASTLHSGA